MKETTKTLHCQGMDLSYRIYGSGRKKIVAVHGFGQDSTLYEAYAQTLGKDYCLYSLDLFFHGQSIWPFKENPLEKRLWKTLFQTFREKEQIGSFSLIGFSIGGKLVLSTLESFADAVTSVTLIAPDGLRLNFWYTLATSAFPFRQCFKQLIQRPRLFFKGLSVIEGSDLMDKRVVRFVRSQMKTKNRREKVYYTWMVYRKLSFNTNKIAAMINHYEIPVTVYLGKSDQVITPKSVNGFLKKLWDYDLKMIRGNHNNVFNNFLKWEGGSTGHEQGRGDEVGDRREKRNVDKL